MPTAPPPLALLPSLIIIMHIICVKCYVLLHPAQPSARTKAPRVREIWQRRRRRLANVNEISVFFYFHSDLTQFIHLWIIFNSGAVFCSGRKKGMHDKTEFCGWKEREGAIGECRTSWKIFIALELKFNPPTNPLPHRLAKLFFSNFFVQFKHTWYALFIWYVLRAHNWGCCGIEGTVCGGRAKGTEYH